MLTSAAGFDNLCPNLPEPKAAAIVNQSGATDLRDLLEGQNARGFAIAWLGGQTGRDEIARRLSPLEHARPGAPPVLSIHGDADQVVPLAHAARLHAELEKHGVANRLVTIPGGGHGGYSREQNEKLYAAVRDFLGQVLPGPRQ